MRFLACILFSVTMILSGFVDAQQVQPQQDDILTGNHPLNDPEITTFRDLVKGTGVYDLFQGTGPFTAFAPSNAAFAKLGTAKIEEMKKDKDKLTTILLYHVVPGKYMGQYMKPETVRTLSGKTLNINRQGNTITINQAKVIRTDLVGPNGVVHIIDTVLAQ